MCRGRSPLDPADCQGRLLKVDLIPTQIHQLGSSEAVPVGHKDHCAVSMAPSVAPGGRKQSLDLALGQIFPSAQIDIRAAPRCDCSFFGGWRDQPEVGFGQDFHPLWRMLFG